LLTTETPLPTDHVTYRKNVTLRATLVPLITRFVSITGAWYKTR
jgi:hypothetical protein